MPLTPTPKVLLAQLLPAIALLGSATSVRAQGPYALRPADDFALAIEKDGRAQALAFLGGLNAPQFAAVDVDGDGRLDYYAFDRAGGVHVAIGAAGADAPEDFVDKTRWVRDWPAAEHFAVPRDFDGDGVPDLFTSAAETGREGVLVYRGTREPDGRISLRQLDFGGDFGAVLPYRTDGDRDQIVYVARTDVPTLDDVDDDGDLDLLAFDPSGSAIYFYRNEANGAGGGGPRSELNFVLATRCFGGVTEDAQTSEIRLASAAGDCATRLFAPPGSDLRSHKLQSRGGGAHPGSTLTLYDLDGDGDRDALIGDVNTGELTALYNEPSGGTTFYERKQAAWPNGRREVPVQLEFLPMAFALPPLGADVGAAATEILVTSNRRGGGEDYENVWRYLAEGSRYGLQMRTFLTDVSLDHGSGTHVASGQLDGRGAPELIVGNDGEYDASAVGSTRAILRYYTCESDGACAQRTPAWLTRLNEALAGSPQLPFTSYDPLLHDMDADGDLDLLVGYSEGGLAYAENTSRPGGPVDFTLRSLQWQGINVGLESSPAAADLNGDGLPDLVIGERNGNLNLYLNVGSASAPTFRATADEEVYAGIETRLRGFGPAVSRPTFVTRPGLAPALYVGTAQGRLLVYDDLPTGPGGTARLTDTVEALAGTLLDPVQSYDAARERDVVLLGNLRGGITAMEFADTSPASVAPSARVTWRVVPNPTGGRFRVAGLAPGSVLDAYDALGRRVADGLPAGGAELPEVLPKGVYTLVGKAPDGTRVALRVMKQ